MSDEADVPTEHQAAQEDPRVPDPDAHPRGAGRDRAAAPEGPRPPLGVDRATLRSPAEFRRVLRSGRGRGVGGLVVHVCERDGGGQPRLGLVVPRTVGGAVARNRMKRRIRSIWRELSPSLGPVDCVVVVRPEAANLNFAELTKGVAAGVAPAARKPRPR